MAAPPRSSCARSTLRCSRDSPSNSEPISSWGAGFASNTICVCVTSAISLPSGAVTRVCHTIVRLPRCRAAHSARMVSPARAGAPRLTVAVMNRTEIHLNLNKDRAWLIDTFGNLSEDEVRSGVTPSENDASTPWSALEHFIHLAGIEHNFNAMIRRHVAGDG